MSTKKKIHTIVDVAKEANVSVATVSSVLNGKGRISAKTTQRVKQTMDALNYQPNEMARRLRAGGTKLIGVLLPDTSEFYMNVAKAFMQQAYTNGYTVFLGDYNYSYNWVKSLMHSMMQKRCEAIVVMGGVAKDEKLLEKMNNDGVRILLLDRRIEDLELSAVEFDNETTMCQLVKRVYGAGYKRIGYLTEAISMANLGDRFEGYKRGLEQCGLSYGEKYVYLSISLQLNKRKNAYQFAMQTFAKDSGVELPEVLLTSSDQIAIGAMDALKDLGYRIPEDIGIFGFDNSTFSEYVTPKLSTVDQDSRRMGLVAWDVINDMVKEKNFIRQKTVLSQQIIVRESCEV